MKYAITLSYFLAFFAVFQLFAAIRGRALLYSISALGGLTIVAALNDHYVFIDEKIASFISYEMFARGELAYTFFSQYLINLAPLLLFDYEFTAHAVNMAIQAAAIYLLAHYFVRSNSLWLFLLLLAFPSFYHYAIFGLRDPLVCLIMVLFAVSAVRSTFAGHLTNCLLLASACAITRPELAPILVLASMFSRYREWPASRKVVVWLLLPLALYASVLVAPNLLGIRSGGGFDENLRIITEFNEIRHDRRVNDLGGGSHVLEGELFELPLIVRYPIQVVASYIAPLPTDIRGPLYLLALLDSLVFCAVAGAAFYYRKRSPTGWYLFWVATGIMFIQAFFTINYGNTLRLRYPVFVLYFASMACGMQARRQPQFYKQATSRISIGLGDLLGSPAPVSWARLQRPPLRKRLATWLLYWRRRITNAPMRPGSLPYTMLFGLFRGLRRLGIRFSGDSIAVLHGRDFDLIATPMAGSSSLLATTRLPVRDFLRPNVPTYMLYRPDALRFQSFFNKKLRNPTNVGKCMLLANATDLNHRSNEWDFLDFLEADRDRLRRDKHLLGNLEIVAHFDCDPQTVMTLDIASDHALVEQLTETNVGRLKSTTEVADFAMPVRLSDQTVVAIERQFSASNPTRA